MLDRRLLLGSLSSLIALGASEALAKAKTKKKTEASSKKKTASKSKASAKTKGKDKAKGKKTRPEPKKAEPRLPPEPAPPPVPAETSPEAAAALKLAFDSLLRDQFMASPVLVTGSGFDKGEYAGLKSRLDDRSEASKLNTIARLKRAVDTLGRVNRNELAATDRINFDTLLWDNTNQLALAQGFAFGDNSGFSGGFPNPYVISQLSGAYQVIPDFLVSQHTLAVRSDADAFVSRLSAFALMLDQETDRARTDFARGIIPPDFILKATIAQLTALRDTDPLQSPILTSLDSRTQAAGLMGPWHDQTIALLTGPVRDALSRQIDALTSILPRATHDAGVLNLSNGAAYYAQCVKLNTSTDMTPKDIHALGLQKVAELTAELDSRLNAMGMTQGSVGERLNAMYTDPRFIYPNTDEGKAKLLADLNAKVNAVAARLPDYFGTLPKAKVMVKRIPVATEAGAPGGYYNPGALDGSRPGMYYINLRNTAEQPGWLLPTLTYHEAIPGHHMQLTIQQEDKTLPMVRKLSSFNAYVEGWAVYAEQLASEMGMYNSDPAGRIGYLHDAIFRAVRLVVDTGMHSLGWSREQAIAYMVDKTGNAESAAASEVERYCVWPGQALGYMIGKIKWLTLRDRVKAKQGLSFNIKTFHDTGLKCGAVPLAVLENVYKDAGLI